MVVLAAATPRAPAVAAEQGAVRAAAGGDAAAIAATLSGTTSLQAM
jgi:hypothetical protein